VITAIIMASGFSRRMNKENSEINNNSGEISNQNKLLMEIKGESLIGNILNIVNEIDFSEKILVYKDETIEGKARKMGFKTVFNSGAEKGMSASLKLGVLNAKTTDAYMFFVADQPLLSVETIKSLIKKTERQGTVPERQGTVLCLGGKKTGDGSVSQNEEMPKKTIFVPRYNKKHGMPTIFLAKWKDELLKIKGDIGGREIIKKNTNEVLFVDIKNAYEGFDVDTWKDYEVIRKNEHI